MLEIMKAASTKLPRIYRASRSYLACALPLVRSARPTRSALHVPTRHAAVT